MLDMGGYGPGAYFILNAAVARNHLRWRSGRSQHGAGPNARTSSHPKFKPGLTLYDARRSRG